MSTELVNDNNLNENNPTSIQVSIQFETKDGDRMLDSNTLVKVKEVIDEMLPVFERSVEYYRKTTKVTKVRQIFDDEHDSELEYGRKLTKITLIPFIDYSINHMFSTCLNYDEDKHIPGSKKTSIYINIPYNLKYNNGKFIFPIEYKYIFPFTLQTVEIDKNELKGIIAHEVSHYINNDLYNFDLLAAYLIIGAFKLTALATFSIYLYKLYNGENNYLLAGLTPVLTYFTYSFTKAGNIINKVFEMEADTTAAIMFKKQKEVKEGLISFFKKSVDETQINTVYKKMFNYYLKIRKYFYLVNIKYPTIKERIDNLENLN